MCPKGKDHEGPAGFGNRATDEYCCRGLKRVQETTTRYRAIAAAVLFVLTLIVVPGYWRENDAKAKLYEKIYEISEAQVKISSAYNAEKLARETAATVFQGKLDDIKDEVKSGLKAGRRQVTAVEKSLIKQMDSYHGKR